MTSINKQLNCYLGGKKIGKYEFDDFSLVIEAVGSKKHVLDWFNFLHSIETVGWRTKLSTQKIARMLARSRAKDSVEFYALFCPSYKKGIGAYGFRTDDIGPTSKWGIEVLSEIVKRTRNLGIACKKPRAIFFDVAVEQPEKATREIDDLKKNIQNFKKHVPKDMEFELLSEKFPFLVDIIGYRGIKVSPLPIPQVAFRRVIERGAKFYKLFGWDKGQIKERSEVVASSEALVGNILRCAMPNSIMVYTPSMLERAQVYSGLKFETDPLPIIFPKHPKL